MHGCTHSDLTRPKKGFTILEIVVVAAILFLTYADRLADRVRKGLNSERAGRRMRDGRVLLATLCFFPVGCVASVSLFDSLIASRVFLIFTPYLLVLISVGINEVSHRLVSSLLIAALLITLHVGSLIYYKEYPTEALDYKDLTGVMNANSQKGDVFVVHKQSWVTTPLFYYLDQNRFKIVAEGLATELNDPETRRVWVVNFEGQPLTDEMRDALAGYQTQFASRGKRAEVVMYERVER